MTKEGIASGPLKYFFEYVDPDFKIIKTGIIRASSLRQAKKKVVDEHGLKEEEFQIQLVM